MKRSILWGIVGLGVSSAVFAQDVAAPARSTMATRPPNVANPRGTDSGAGVACDLVMNYGAVQPAGQAALPYGGNNPPQVVANPWAEAAAAPAAGRGAGRAAQPADGAAGARGARAGGGGGAVPLGAAGMAMRGTVIPTAPMLPYENVEGPNPPTGTQFANVASVGLLKNGHLVAFQREPMYELLEYDADNRLVRSFDPDIVSRPHGMFIDKDDNIWLSDQQCSTVVKLNSRGEVLMRLGTNGKAGSWDEAKGDHLFNEPTAVAVGPKGDVFVSTGHGGPDPRVVKFDKNGKFLTTWTLKHEDNTPPAANIHALAVDKEGTVFIGDREAKNLLIYDSNGKHLKTVHMQNLICSLYIDSKDQLWMTAGFDGMFMHLDKNGNVLGWAGKEGFGANEFGEAHAMTMSPDGKTIYVADTVNNDIKRYRRTN